MEAYKNLEKNKREEKLKKKNNLYFIKINTQ
jgi:hypothetical protein